MLLGFSFSLLLTYCSNENDRNKTAERGFRNLEDSVEYVGMENCRGCHESIYQSYIQTGMGQSFHLAKPENSSARFAHAVLKDSFSDLNYKPFWRGDSLFLTEFRLSEGDTIFKRTEHIQYIVGSGHHTNSHMLNLNGYVFQAPFTYYTQDSVLDFPPGFEKGNNSRWGRQIQLECMSCHNGLPEHVPGSQNKYLKIPEGIDCERCHGPGALHVKEKKAGILVDVGKETDYSIVNPARLSYDYQIDLCQRCHLQGNALLKDGKSWVDFKPGMRLQEVMNVFMPTLADSAGTFIMAAHPDRLRQSKCFVESVQNEAMASMTCITCHNPHQSVRQTKRDYFNSKCMDCHSASNKKLCKQGETDNCVSCHMKKSSTVDIPHVSVTDHFIRVYEEEGIMERQKAAADRSNEFTGLACVNNPSVSAYEKARAYLNFYEKFDARTLFLDSADHYIEQCGTDEKLRLMLQASFLRQEWESLPELESRVRKLELSAANAYRMGQAMDHLGRFQQAIYWYERALKGHELFHEYRVKLAQACLKLNQLDRAKTELNFVLKEQPFNVKALNALGFCYLLEEEAGRAMACFLKCLRFDPTMGEAQLNIAKVHLLRQDIEKAKESLQKLIQRGVMVQEASLLLQQIKSAEKG